MIGLRIFVRAVSITCLALPTLASAECKVGNYGTLPVEVVGQRATTMANVNGKPARFMLDTGAALSFMARANADAMGLKREAAPFGLRMAGIGGSTDTELTHIKSLGLLGATLPNVMFVVGGTDTGMAVIGANLLDLMDLDSDLANGKLQLLRPQGCNALSMAYWSKDGRYNVADLHYAARDYDHRSLVDVTIHGKTVRAVLDTGATTTLITRRAAERVGMDLSLTHGAANLISSGVGRRSQKGWVVPIDSYAIGTEQIQHSKIVVLDGDLGDTSDAPEMLLGIDFFLAHHVFVANSQRKVYFTYNGGRVFSLAQAPKAAPATDDAAKPLSAADYALRGQARLSRGETAGALADLDAAVGLAPDDAAYRLARARARLSVKKSDEAMEDLGAAIRLDQQNIDALLLRARIRYARKDRDAAEQDVAAARLLAAPGSMQATELVRFYMGFDRPLEALPLLDDWIRLHPEDVALPATLSERAWARALANVQIEGALADATKAIRASKDRGNFYDSLGLVQLRLGRNAEAQASFEKALALLSRSAWTHYGLGLARLRNGQTGEGQAEIAAAKAINPEIATRAARFGLVP